MTGDKKQSEKFKDLAREVGADENERTFADKLRRIVKQKPDKPKEKRDDK